LQIKVVSPDDKDLMALINELDKELQTRYPKEGIFALDFNNPKINTATFVVAYSGNIPVGCGAILPMCRECVELKRFFVSNAHRRKGIASGILLLLESEAKKQYYSIIKLETGPNQPESLHLYKKFGYYEIKKFGEYINSKYSICLEKKL
jgi:ribosomal protein S18 acetylase RimI-like enzyme